ncbi:MAG: amino acid ABC transporter substrate-binding protein [Bacillota bacterium]|nr:MAG: amino acid ABC transporter substrate-binding protein [Bacillota bacterium]
MKKLLLKLLCCATAVTMCATAFTGCGRKFSGDKLAIGGIGPLTGAAADYGTAVKNSIELAIEEVNADGGINGVQLELIFEDDEAEGEKALNAYNVLKNAGMQLLIGTVTSGSGVMISESAKNDNMFMLSPSGSDPDVIKYDNAFRVCLEDPAQGKLAAEYVLENLATLAPNKKIGMLSCDASDYSKGIARAFEAEIAKDTSVTLVKQSFPLDTETEFSAQATVFNSKDVDLVFLPIYYQAAACFIREAQKHVNLKDAKIIGGDGLDGIVKELGADSALAEDALLVTLFSAALTTEPTKSYVDSYKAKYGSVPSQFGADAYDAVYIIKQALEYAVAQQGESFDANTSASELCNILKAAMTEIKFTGVTGTDIEWTAEGVPTDRIRVVKIQDGAYVDVE